MKKLIVAVSLMLGAVGILKADDNILFNVGPVNVLLPFADVAAVYQYDGVGKRSMVGGETPLIQVWKLQFTGGAVTSIDGQGTPFVGVNLKLSNPMENFVPLAALNPGLFAGRDFRTNEWIAGVKASMSIFQ